MRTVSSGPVAAEQAGAVLPERVQEALGELAGAAKEGLLALSASDVGCCTKSWPPKSTSSRDRKASTTRSATPCVTATSAGR